MSPLLLSEIQARLYMALVCVLCAVPCSALGWRDRIGPGRMLSLGTIAFAIGLPALLFKDFLPHLPTLLIGNVLVLGAMGLFWHVTARLCGRPRPPFWTVLPAPLAWAACWSWPAFRADLDLRIAVASFLTGAMAAVAAAELRHLRRWGLPHRLLMGVGAIYVTICAIRCALALDEQHVGLSPFWVTCTELNVLGYIVLWPALCLALISQGWIEQESRLGSTDELSGLLNRRGFMKSATRSDGTALLLFDIDHFKRINDSFGHACGDAVIVGFAAAARAVLGPGAAIGRIGGEEFAVLVRDEPGGHAEAVAERVRREFASQVLPTGVRATASVGIARGTAGDAIEHKLARADHALYRAKRGGRNRVETWTPEMGDGAWSRGEALVAAR